ncbi:thioredoxin family protein [Candidatus Saccharibacteria bacterium]|nr:MAG: thioredoxin family protein [Candidatus Saccharibacteria bacterium]
MNKKALITISIVVGLLLVGGGVVAYTNDQNTKEEQQKMAMQKKADDEAMVKKAQDSAMAKDTVAQEGDSMAKDETMAKQGSYVTLADYDKDPSKYADTKKVYFFHASWCSICQGIDKEIKADMSKIPAGVTLIKTDFDSSTDLRKKFGVTVQYTFVQADNTGNETAQWSATSLTDVLAGIKS